MNTPLKVRGQPWVLDAILFAFFVYDGFGLKGLPVAIPVSQVAAILLVGLSFFRARRLSLGSSRWVFPVFIILVIYLCLESSYNDVDWTRRAFRLCIMVALVWALATGRLNMLAALKGIGIGLAINALLFYSGLAPDNYSGHLTGFIGDKNVAGLYYTIFPLLIASILKTGWRQYVCIILGVGAVYLTGSRTSLFAYAAALIWLLLARRLSKLGKGILAVGLFYGFQYAENNFAREWIFSDREGSDLLRERIEQAAIDKTDTAPWYGFGLGQARVSMDDRFWFFHDSFLALMVEGGWIMLIVILGIYIWFGFGISPKKPQNQTTQLIEASTIAIFVCALKLGEVFLALPGFVLIAYGIIAATGNYPAYRFRQELKVDKL